MGKHPIVMYKEANTFYAQKKQERKDTTPPNKTLRTGQSLLASLSRQKQKRVRYISTDVLTAKQAGQGMSESQPTTTTSRLSTQ